MSGKENLVEILDLGDRGEWFEIVNIEGAKFAEKITQTAVSVFYNEEFNIEDGHPRRWFVLLTGDEGNEKGSVCIALLGENLSKDDSFLNGEKTSITGYRNANPFPEFEFEVSELSDAIGLEIDLNFMYSSNNI